MENFSELKQVIGEVVYRRRLVARISQEELAGKAGLERSYLSLLEHGKRMPGVEILYRLAAAFGIEPTTLFQEIDDHWKKKRKTPPTAL